MTDTTEVEMETPPQEEPIVEASSIEEQDESGPHKPKSRIYPGEIIEGKREKKTVQRLNLQMGKPKEKLKIESLGLGYKFGDIARVNHAIGKLKAPQLKPLHKILYDRPGAVTSLRKNLRLFNGFPFEIDSDPYNKKKEKLQKLPKIQLRTICQILDLEISGTQSVLADRIMQFIIKPTNSGKPVILKKKKKKKTTKDAKQEKKISSKSKQQHQQLENVKSKAIVTDSSSDELEDDDDKSENEDGDKSDSQKHEGAKSNSEEDSDSDEGPQDDKNEEKSKSTKPSSKKKPTTKKESEDSDSDQTVSEDDDEDESAEDTPPKKVKKKSTAQKKVKAKPDPKTKKADSSSSRKKNAASKIKLTIESSDDDDDEPLIKMIKRPPSDDQLKSAVKDLLKDANLEVVTMKQICQQVYDLYPDFDLSTRKDFLKKTVTSLIS